MSFTKYTMYAALLANISCLAMHLTKERLQEFINDKKQLIQIGQEYLPNDWRNNKLIIKYQELADKDGDQLAEFFDSSAMQHKILYLYHSIYTKAEYQAAKKDAVATKDNEKWYYLRIVNGNLLKDAVEEQYGVTYKELTSPGYLATHANSSDEIIAIELAKSFLMYHMRDFQKEKTGKECEPIDFRKQLPPLK
jgi:hypothetical protein